MGSDGIRERQLADLGWRDASVDNDGRNVVVTMSVRDFDEALATLDGGDRICDHDDCLQDADVDEAVADYRRSALKPAEAWWDDGDNRSLLDLLKAIGDAA